MDRSRRTCDVEGATWVWGPALCFSFLFLVICAMGCEVLEAQDPGDGAGEGTTSEVEPVQVDMKRGEVRISCWFVNPTRLLEVFACHESGPSHEAVVAFKAEGGEIEKALRKIGCRGGEFWNATSPSDLRLTGGDRVVVWLRWEWKGQVREVPAEEILQEEATGLPLFLRGFSFTAEPVLMGDPPRRGIPPVVEITIGGRDRQSASFSVLSHPDDFPEMVYWMPAPEVSSTTIPDLEELVKSRNPCALIVRRLTSEEEFVELALSREVDPGRRAVRESQKPIAALLDRRKLEYENLAREVGDLIRAGEEEKDLSPEETEKIVSRIKVLVGTGGLLAAKIQKLYLDLWDLEEEYRHARARNLTTIDSDQKAWVDMAYRSGFRFEIALAARREEMAALKTAAGGGSPESRALLAEALAKEVEGLVEERERRWARFKLVQQVEPRLKDLDPTREPYTYQIFEEDRLRTLAHMLTLRARVEGARLEAGALRARAGGGQESGALARWRKRIDVETRLGALELEHVQIMEKLRWARNPPGGNPDDEDKTKISRFQEELLSKKDQVQKLRATLEAVGGSRDDEGDRPPRDHEGKPLFSSDDP